jgi:hypothetical protein
MKLVVPHVGELDRLDRRLVELAEFLGGEVTVVRIPRLRSWTLRAIEELPCERSWLVVNPRVFEEWFGGGPIPANFETAVLSRYRHVLVHGARMSDFDGELVKRLSAGYLAGVHYAGRSASASYSVASDAGHVCGPFTGLTIEGMNETPECAFRATGGGVSGWDLISVNAEPYMTLVKRGGSEVLFIGGQGLSAPTAELGDRSARAVFPRVVPHAMALRYVYGREAWRPRNYTASVTIDDPLLRPRYGFLKYDELLSLLEQHRFHTTLAFIPHNYQRTSKPLARRLFGYTDRFSLCFHGNDHTGGEFGSTDFALLNTLLETAEKRMSRHRALTGLDCEKVMIFPQGKFSTTAMLALKARNFIGAVNTGGSCVDGPPELTLSDILEPAITRYSGFALFLRDSCARTQLADVALKAFFGRPVLIGEHHDIFQNPDEIARAVARINTVVPQVCWTGLRQALARSYLIRRAGGVVEVRAYSSLVQVANDECEPARFRIYWPAASADSAYPVGCIRNGKSEALQTSGGRWYVDLELQPGSCETLEVLHSPQQRATQTLGFRRTLRGFVRRRLSELRDNHLSSHPYALAAATAFRRRILG